MKRFDLTVPENAFHPAGAATTSAITDGVDEVVALVAR
ncbi:hypothetical protein BJ998_007320 [Kutzneria kofuensis]|uniref:Uncharacterized protein n=1 Tax=Kutzneria kofuensis TaxID=103725 RepID=A0A7W9NKW2_9PSEU|nr:hypothetical protein [Kutzneria kofuensis]